MGLKFLLKDLFCLYVETFIHALMVVAVVVNGERARRKKITHNENNTAKITGGCGECMTQQQPAPPPIAGYCC